MGDETNGTGDETNGTDNMNAGDKTNGTGDDTKGGEMHVEVCLNCTFNFD